MEPSVFNFANPMVPLKKQVLPPTRSRVDESHNGNSKTLNLHPPLKDNDAPFLSALKEQADQNVVSFCFPGHNNGKAAPPLLSKILGKEIFLLDSPVMPFHDNLITPKGPILAAQKRAAELFGSSETWFLTGGTTCGILAAIMATVSPGEVLILPRTAHISATNALVLSGAVPKYIFPEYNVHWDLAGGVNPLDVKRAIEEVKKDGKKIAAVFVTSPTYQGICSDVAGIAKLCHSNGIPLIVDEAHGAHFHFHAKLPSTALEQGADLVIQSTHKVLCSLQQSSMMHISGSNLVQRERVSKCLQILHSTSPSYFLLASLDATTAELRENSSSMFKTTMKIVAHAKSAIQSVQGIEVLELFHFESRFPAMDPFRITFKVSNIGFTGFQASEILRGGFNVYCEMAGKQFVTIALNLGTSEKDIDQLVLGLKYLSSSSNKNEDRSSLGVKRDFYNPFADINVKLTPREAFFSAKKRVGIEESVGMICGELVVPYPPGIATLCPGEVITKDALSYLSDAKQKGATIDGVADRSLSSVLVCDT